VKSPKQQLLRITNLRVVLNELLIQIQPARPGLEACGLFHYQHFLVAENCLICFRQSSHHCNYSFQVKISFLVSSVLRRIKTKTLIYVVYVGTVYV